MSGIFLECVYRASPAEVWHALTDRDELAAWLMPTDFVAEVGHRFTFRTKPRLNFDGIVRCEVLEIIPERRLSYRWQGGDQDTVVVWELSPEGAATRLKLRHTGFTGPTGALTEFVLGRGWGKLLRRYLRRWLERKEQPR